MSPSDFTVDNPPNMLIRGGGSLDEPGMLPGGGVAGGIGGSRVFFAALLA